MTHELAAVTDPGRQRKNNEDAALATALQEGGALLVVADGVGGAVAGEIASSLTVATVAETMHNAPPMDRDRYLMQAVVDANLRVRQEAQARPDLTGMASTIVAASVTDADGDTVVAMVHLGDSRAYLFDGAGLQRKTADHSWVEEQVQSGLLPADEAPGHPYRNVITRAIGMSDTVELDTMARFSIPPGSVLLLCTDGLYGAVSPAQIAETLASGEPLEVLAEQLVGQANAAGGPDNIGIALLRVGTPAV